MTKEMYEDLLERNRLQISELNTLTEEQDKRIVELEATNKKISDECHKLVDSLEKEQDKNVELIGKIAFLENDLNNAKAQIEKMKCCYNCKQSQDESYCKIKKSDINDLSCWDCGCDKWEIKENEEESE